MIIFDFVWVLFLFVFVIVVIVEFVVWISNVIMLKIINLIIIFFDENGFKGFLIFCKILFKIVNWVVEKKMGVIIIIICMVI